MLRGLARKLGITVRVYGDIVADGSTIIRLVSSGMVQIIHGDKGHDIGLTTPSVTEVEPAVIYDILKDINARYANE